MGVCREAAVKAAKSGEAIAHALVKFFVDVRAHSSSVLLLSNNCVG